MKTTTQAAQCAATIRKELKEFYPKTTFRVRSKTFSMGDSVAVDWTDGPLRDEIQKLLGKYEYGQFDGMTDYYEITNYREDIPQTKYLFCNREASRERTQAAVDWLNAHTAFVCSINERGGVDGDYNEDLRERPSAIIHRMLSGYYTNTQPEMDFSK